MNTAALPYDHYGDPAALVEMDESRLFQARHGCAVCTHEGETSVETCKLKRRKNPQGWCGGFDLDEVKVDQYGLSQCKGRVR